MITNIFIISSLIIWVVYDIWALVTKRKTITSWFRKWYGIKPFKDKGLPVVPYAIGAVLLGHFPLWINFSFINACICLALFILLSLLVIVWTIDNEISFQDDPDDCNKFYFWMKNKWYISMAVGAVIGCLWWM